MANKPTNSDVSAFDAKRRWFRIASRFQYSYMSNAKWRKVFTAIATSGVEVRRCEFKCINSDYIELKYAPPQTSDLYESRFADDSYQPFEYKWIEWFRFPREFKPVPGVGLVVQQDVESLRAAIMAAADACVELDENYLWLFGYRGRHGVST